jgi:hypothetical protein
MPTKLSKQFQAKISTLSRATHNLIDHLVSQGVHHRCVTTKSFFNMEMDPGQSAQLQTMLLAECEKLETAVKANPSDHKVRFTVPLIPFVLRSIAI